MGRWAVRTLVAVFALLVLAPPAGGGADSHQPCTRGTFPSYQPDFPPPDGYRPVFELSQDYPQLMPAAEDYPWRQVPRRDLASAAGARRYLDLVFDYVTEGNIDVDWVGQLNGVRTWYHAPWMHVGRPGREFAHGLTNELNSQPFTLGPDQTEVAQTWAVGLFNDRGAWAIGQIWCDPTTPDLDALNPEQDAPNSFPDGTAVVKLLFTSADETAAPYLAGAFEWEADIHVEPTGSDARELQTVRLIQMDVAVRDDRLPLGWAFGTFAYASDALGPTPWDRLVPLGLQWGNDPGVTPAMVERGTPLTEQWINTDTVAVGLPGNHLGWAGRLAGPLDNRLSSCMSCHMTAGSPALSLVPPSEADDRERLSWFVDTPAGVPAGVASRQSTDYSLQLSMGYQNFLHSTCQPAALLETVSARGDERTAPRDMALEQCENLQAGGPTATTAPTGATAVGDADSGGDDGAPWWAVVLAALTALALGLGLGAWFARRGRRDDAATDPDPPPAAGSTSSRHPGPPGRDDPTVTHPVTHHAGDAPVSPPPDLSTMSDLDRAMYFFETVFSGSTDESPAHKKMVDEMILHAFGKGYTYNGKPMEPKALIAWRESLLKAHGPMTFRVHNALSTVVSTGESPPTTGVCISWVIHGTDDGKPATLHGMNLIGFQNGVAVVNNQLGDPGKGWKPAAES